MRVLVAYGSKMGGSAGIAELIGGALTAAGFQAGCRQTQRGSRRARWPRSTPATGASPSASGAGRPMWRWSCCRLTSWDNYMPNRFTMLWNGQRPPEGELWP
jgi:hypothetical protein